jgi:holo-[acyl-carrier protein] synthase
MADSIGIDIADVARFRRLLDRYGPRLVDRILSREEAKIFARRHDRVPFLAGRFAAKEAVIKALGKYLSTRPSYSQIEILNDQAGRPLVHLPEALDQQLSGIQLEISISHEQSYAIGLAICTEKP